MKKYLLYLSLMTTIMMTSCKLSEPPTCVTGAERCESNEVITGTGIYQVCSETGEWGDDFVCAAGCKDDLHCSNDDESMPKCSEDGKIRCKTIDDITLAFNCRDGLWLPSICYSNQCSEESGCIDSTQACEGSSSRCIDVPDIGSVQIDCIDQKKTTFYCPKGITCDGDKCADGTISSESVLACGEEKTNCTQSIEHWKSGRCTNGACIVTECESGYHPYETSCEKDDSNNCGNHDHPCTKDQVNGSATVSCDTGKCIAITCDNDHTIDETNHICIEKQATCTQDKCINSVNQGILYKCLAKDLSTEGIECIDKKDNALSCNHEGTGCGTCLNETYQCSDDKKQLLKCKDGDFGTDQNCSSMAGDDVNARSYCGIADGHPTCIKECTNDYHKDDDGNCTIQCESDKVWDESQHRCVIPNCMSLTNPKVSDICIFGRYPQTEDGGIEELEWQILSIEPGSMLMITKYVLEARPFSQACDSSSPDSDPCLTKVWENSSIRSWLNGLDATHNTSNLDYTTNNFMKTAFTEEEKQQIYEVHDNPNPDGETSEWLFLLSKDEANSYFASNEERKSYATPYAQRDDILVVNYSDYINTHYCSASWLLRSPGVNPNEVAFVHCQNGIFSPYDAYVYVNTVGVRPALRLIH